MKRNAFSLVELLVVILVIALLVAIVMPQLSAARATARSAICKHNLRQIGAAFDAVANEPRLAGESVRRYPDPRKFPNVPYNVVPQEKLFICPEDETGNWSVIDGLRYSAYFSNNRFPLRFEDGDKCSLNNQVCVRARRGSDERGYYSEFVFEENYVYENGCEFWDHRPWHPSGPDYSDNDGLFRIYDNIPKRGRVLRLEYYTCSLDNRGYLYDEGLFEASGVLIGHAGEEVDLGGLCTSYGINAKVYTYQVPASMIVLLDYEEIESDISCVADPDNSAGLRARLRLSGRHRGKVNVLSADQSVWDAWPEDLYPDDNRRWYESK